MFNNNTLLWIDDIRNPFYDTWVNDYSPIYVNSSNVVWVTSYNEFVEWVSKNGLPEAICFDHDLGDTGQHEKTGYDCAKWLVDYCLDNNCDIPAYNIQSSNGPGADNIRSLLDNYHKYFLKG